MTQPTFEKFKPLELQVPPDKSKSTEGFPFEFKLGRRMVHELKSFVEGSRDPITQISTPKIVEEVIIKVMKWQIWQLSYFKPWQL